MLTPDTLDRLKTLAAQATPGPFTIQPLGSAKNNWQVSRYGAHPLNVAIFVHRGNAEFFVALYGAFEDMMAELDRLYQEREAMAGELERLRQAKHPKREPVGA